tara:strand:+ start:458 stop:1450 length:993 start_codon:yes stop_codon:yes gene_type:complete
MNEKWDCLLFKFRSLGGIAENICQKQGQFGRGIFPVNPNLTSRIYTPSKLMIKTEDICLEGNQVRIKQDKNYSKELKNFFNYYQDNFSWGGGGKDTTEAFEKGLGLFSSTLKNLIKKYILIDLKQRHIGDWDKVILRQFLGARQFDFNNLAMICPLLELVNHEVISLSFIKGLDGISTPNYPILRRELTHAYNNKSSIKRFFYQGFFCQESIVYSFPFILNLNDLGLKIHCKGDDLDDDCMKVKRSNNIISIEGLPIADLNHPRLPYHYFTELIRRIGVDNISKELLSNIIKLNIAMRKNILQESKLINNEVSNMFTEVIKHELNLIFYK